MRDDARSIVGGLTAAYAKKIDLLHRLLLSESDKLYYQKSGNIDRVIEIIREDEQVIDAVDLVDYDIAGLEKSLSTLIGIRAGALYGLLADAPEARGLVAARREAREALTRLLGERAELTRRLESSSRSILESIGELAHIGRLKRDENGDIPPFS